MKTKRYEATLRTPRSGTFCRYRLKATSERTARAKLESTLRRLHGADLLELESLEELPRRRPATIEFAR